MSHVVSLACVGGLAFLLHMCHAKFPASVSVHLHPVQPRPYATHLSEGTQENALTRRSSRPARHPHPELLLPCTNNSTPTHHPQVVQVTHTMHDDINQLTVLFTNHEDQPCPRTRTSTKHIENTHIATACREVVGPDYCSR